MDIVKVPCVEVFHFNIVAKGFGIYSRSPPTKLQFLTYREITTYNEKKVTLHEVWKQVENIPGLWMLWLGQYVSVKVMAHYLVRVVRAVKSLSTMSSTSDNADLLDRNTRSISFPSLCITPFGHGVYGSVKWVWKGRPFASQLSISFLPCVRPSDISMLGTPNTVYQ